MKRQQKKRGVYRNNSEAKVGAALKEHKIKFSYETFQLIYQLPESKYLPDFICEDAQQIWEVKGRFVDADRKKHLALKQQHPEWEVRFIFLRPADKVRKGAKLTYGGWCEKHGFKYCHIDKIPQSWWKEVK